MADYTFTDEQEQIIRQWVDDLRSGKFPQTRGKLGRTRAYADFGSTQVEPAGFCCLGVLCEQAVTAGVIEPATADDTGVLTYGSYDDAELPEVVKDWVDLPNFSPEVEYSGPDGVERVTLVELNDTRGLTFPEIADVIEENFLR